MDQTAIAIHENGVLRLLSPLGLPERTHVRVVVQPVDPSSGAEEHRWTVRRILVEAGLMRPEEPTPIGKRLTEEEREDLARRIAGAGPLSELIIEECREGP